MSLTERRVGAAGFPGYLKDLTEGQASLLWLSFERQSKPAVIVYRSRQYLCTFY